MTLEAGSKLGPYEIVEPLGAGGMGEVYRARDTRLEREVAIKVLPEHLSESPELRQRLEREARVVSSLQHPNICTLHDIGSENGVDFLVMEYLDGVPLEKRGDADFLSLEAGDWIEREKGYEYRQHRALVSGERKWIASIDPKLKVGQLHFLDLGRDPGELAPGPWRRGEAGQTLLRWFAEDPDPAGWPRSMLRGQQLDGPKVAPGRSEDELRALRALGYVE